MTPTQAESVRRAAVRRWTGSGGFRAMSVLCVVFAAATGFGGCNAESETTSINGIVLPDGTYLPEPPLPLGLDELDPETVALVHQRRSEVIDAMREPAGWLILGMVYHAHLQYEPARQCYQAATSLGSNDPRVPYLDALILARLGDRSAAIERMLEANELAPRHGATAWRLAQWYLESGEIEAAVKWSDRAVHRSPDDVSAKLVRARVLLQQDQHDEAAAALEQLAEQYPEDRYVRLLLGTAYRGVGRFEDAVREMERGRGAEPTWHDAWMREMQAYYVGFRAAMMRALAYLRANHPDAIEQFEALREREPGNVDVLVNLSIAYRRHAQPERALDVLHEAAAVEPGRFLVQFHLAATYRQLAGLLHGQDAARMQQMLVEGAEHARTAIEIQPRDPNGYGMLGEILQLLESWREAAMAYERAAELDPTNALWLVRHGAVMMEMQRWADAIGLFEQAAQRSPDDYSVLILLAQAQVQAGLYQDAQQTVLHGAKHFPDRSEWNVMMRGIEQMHADSMQQGAMMER